MNTNEYQLDLAEEILELEELLSNDAPEVEPPTITLDDLIYYALASELE